MAHPRPAIDSAGDPYEIRDAHPNQDQERWPKSNERAERVSRTKSTARICSGWALAATIFQPPLWLEAEGGQDAGRGPPVGDKEFYESVAAIYDLRVLRELAGTEKTLARLADDLRRGL